jgi:GTPase
MPYQDDIIEVRERVTRIETKLDHVINKIDDHHDRLANMEAFKTKLVAGAITISAVATLAWDILKSKIGI